MSLGDGVAGIGDGDNSSVSSIAGFGPYGSLDPSGSADQAGEVQRQITAFKQHMLAAAWNQAPTVPQNPPQLSNSQSLGSAGAGVTQWSNLLPVSRTVTDADPSGWAPGQRYAENDPPPPIGHNGPPGGLPLERAPAKAPSGTDAPSATARPAATLSTPARPGVETPTRVPADAGRGAGTAAVLFSLADPARTVGPHRLSVIRQDFLAHQQPLEQNFGQSLQLHVYSDQERSLDPNAKWGSEAKANFFKANPDGTKEKLPVDVQINETYPRSPGQPLNPDAVYFDPTQLDSAARASGVNLDQLPAADRERLGLPKVATENTAPTSATPAQPASRPKVSAPTGADLQNYREKIGVPTRNTVALARPDIEVNGKPAPFNGTDLEGASPTVRTEGNLPEQEQGPIKSPAKVDRAVNHAEQDVLNQFVKAVKETYGDGLKPVKVNGADTYPQVTGKVYIHQSNEGGICSNCRQGVGNTKDPGVFLQASRMFPNIEFIASTETVPGVSADPGAAFSFTLRNGKYVGPVVR
jgi:hypothetical protein